MLLSFKNAPCSQETGQKGREEDERKNDSWYRRQISRQHNMTLAWLLCSGWWYTERKWGHEDRGRAGCGPKKFVNYLFRFSWAPAEPLSEKSFVSFASRLVSFSSFLAPDPLPPLPPSKSTLCLVPFFGLALFYFLPCAGGDFTLLESQACGKEGGG